jgi:hypothetical protein
MSFAFDFADPEFAAAELNTPRPCKHASNCFYNGSGGCAFVHPGEEGTGLQIFPARTTTNPETGEQTWQKATVRLIGGAKFYERRRLKMSWPQWRALPKNSHLIRVTPKKVSPPPPIPSIPSIVDIMMAYNTHVQEQTRLIHEKTYKEYEKQQMGNAIYRIVEPFLAEQQQAMKDGGIWKSTMTAGKITGMLLDGLEKEELLQLIADNAAFQERMSECCLILIDSV